MQHVSCKDDEVELWDGKEKILRFQRLDRCHVCLCLTDAWCVLDWCMCMCSFVTQTNRSWLPASYLWFRLQFAPAMSKRSSDAKGSMNLDSEGEGEGLPKQPRTAKWYCARCKKEIDDNQYHNQWWTQWSVGYFCMECSRKYEAEEAEKKKGRRNNYQRSGWRFEHGL